jgi:hypothetical protein
MHRVVKFRRPNGVLDGLTFEEITSIRTVGTTKALGIAEALEKLGIEVKGIPEKTEPTRLVENDDGFLECTNCHSELRGHPLVSSQYYRFCPMCGKKLKW